MCKYLNQVQWSTLSKNYPLGCKMFWLCSTGRFGWWGSGPLFCQRCWSARWKFAQCLYMVFPRQSSIGACQNLEGCHWMCAFPRTPPKRMLRQCFRHYVRTLTCSDILTPDLGTALIENYVHDKFFVLVAFHEIQWQENHLCPVMLKKNWKSNIRINWIWSIFTDNQKLKIWSSTNFSLNHPDCIS